MRFGPLSIRKYNENLIIELKTRRMWFEIFTLTPNRCIHGPQMWPWWLPFGLGFVTLEFESECTRGWRLWIYVRRHTAISVDLVFGRVP